MSRRDWEGESLKRWDQRFLGVCIELSTWSSCLSRQIGAVIVKDRTIVSTGFNGPPRGVKHCGEVYGGCPRHSNGYKSGEGLELCPAAHAETNTIVNAARLGVSTLGTSIYMNCGIPCRECLKLIINAGINEIVCTDTEDWYDEISKFLVKESNLLIRSFRT
ncbi:MAG: dCMP deaminase family protein [Gammaproteobacteria bacterium]|nr:dCMP deaminase family protein [Gammaproteobacteria bacterium]